MNVKKNYNHTENECKMSWMFLSDTKSKYINNLLATKYVC